MKKILFAAAFVLLAFAVYKFVYRNENSKEKEKTEERFSSQVNEVKKLIKKDSKYNQDIVFLIDMKIPSGKNRFFVYDLKKK